MSIGEEVDLLRQIPAILRLTRPSSNCLRLPVSA